MSRTIHLLGVPSSAGAHWPGQEKAPAALRGAGLAECITSSGRALVDAGEVPLARWQIARTEHEGHLVNNLEETIRVARDVSSAVATALADGGFPVVIGGDCTITVGAISGALHAGLDPALIYVDGGWDLSTPAIYPGGILDSMGAAHMLGIEGTTALRDIGPRTPMLAPDGYIPFGYEVQDPPGKEADIARVLGLRGISANEARDRGAEAARETLAAHTAPDRPYWVHFDVDVINFFDVPLADVPVYTEVLSFADAIAAVEVFVADPRCIGMTVTEFNPDHGHPGGREAEMLATNLARILSRAS